MNIALNAADTGHLVMSTLHTMNAVETVNRIVAFYPPHQHQHVRIMLANTLVSIICLRLLPRKDGKGRLPLKFWQQCKCEGTFARSGTDPYVGFCYPRGLYNMVLIIRLIHLALVPR